MYHTYAENKQAYQAVELKYVLMARKPGAEYLKKNLSAERGYSLYQNALKNTLGFLVLGRTNVDKEVFRRVAGPAIENDMLHNFGATNDGGVLDPRIQGGSSPYVPNTQTVRSQGGILHYPSHNPTIGIDGNAPWHFLINDSFILAGVHNHQKFHLASPRTRENLQNEWGSTVTFRELIGLRAFGYKIRRSPVFTSKTGTTMQLNDVAYCSNPRTAENATFSGYWDAVEMYQDKPHEFVGPGCNW